MDVTLREEKCCATCDKDMLQCGSASGHEQYVNAFTCGEFLQIPWAQLVMIRLLQSLFIFVLFWQHFEKCGLFKCKHQIDDEEMLKMEILVQYRC